MKNNPRFIKGFYIKMYAYHGDAETKVTKNDVLVDKFTWLTPTTIEVNEDYIISKEKAFDYNGQDIEDFWAYVIADKRGSILYKRYKRNKK